MDRTLRILHVEDSEQDSSLLAHHITAAGFDLLSKRVEAADAMTAALAGEEWDLILCDYSMPGFSALAALSILRESGLDIPFIIISGTVDEEVAVKALLTGANDYIPKGNLARLVPAIERELHQADDRRAKRKAEAALKASEGELRALFAAMSDMILVFDYDGRHVKVAPTNPAHVYSRGTYRIGKTVHEILPTDVADFFLENIRQSLDEARTLHTDYSLVIDGKDVWFDATVTPMTEDSVMWVARDVTERKRAEDELRESESLLAASQRITHQGSWVIDLSGSADGRPHKERWSDEHYRIFGFEPGEVELTDELFYEAIHPDDRARLAKTIRDAITEKMPFDIEHRIILPDGEERVVQAMAELVLDEETGKPLKLLGSVQDITERKRAESDLQHRQTELRVLFDVMPAMVWFKDTKDNILRVNKQVAEAAGRSIEEIEGKPSPEIYPETAAKFYADDLNVIESGKPKLRYVEMLPGPDGAKRWLQTDKVPYFDTDGNPIGIVVMAQDVTLRKDAEEALEESEERNRELVENAIDIIYTHDLAGNYTSVNKAGERITGYTLDEILKMNIAGTVAPAYLDKARQMIAEKLAGNDITAYEIELIVKDDRRVALEVNTRIIYAGGVAIGVQGIARDITERKKTQESLRETEERYRDLVENAIDIIYTLDVNGNYTSVNKACEQITGYKREESLTRSMFDSIAPDYVETGRQMLASHLAGINMPPYELELIAKDGRRIAIEVSTRPIIEDGVSVGVQGIARDITDRKLIDAALVASELRYHSLFENMIEGYAYCETIFEDDRLTDFVYIEVNGAFEKLTGLKNVAGRRVSEVIPGIKDINPELFEIYGRVALSGNPEKFETYLEALDLWLSITVYSSAREQFVAVFDNITKRKRAETLLTESQEQLALAAASVKLGIWDWNVVDDKLEWDARMFELYGINEKDFTGVYDAWETCLHPDDREQNEAHTRDALAGERPFNTEFRVIWPNGEVHHLEARALIERNDEGKAIRMIGVNWDITERKGTAIKLEALTIRTERRERMLTTMLSSMTDFAQIYDRAGRLLFANQPLLTVWGLTLDDVVGKDFHDLKYPYALANKLQQQIEQVFNTSQSITDESSFTGVDGITGHYEYIFSPAIGADGNVDFVVGSTRDVTERNLSEERLKYSQTNLAKSQEIAHLGSWDLIIPETGKINEGVLEWSDEVFRIFGYEPNQVEVSNDVFFNAVHPDDRADVAAAMTKALAEGGEYRIDHRIVRPDGSERFVHEHSEIIRDKQTGEPVKMVGTIQDITIQKQLGEQLRQSQKMEAVGVLAGGIAHDFNNLLTAIIGYSILTLNKMAPDDPYRHNIEEVKNAGDRAAELTGQLLAFSRKQVMQPAVVNLNTIIASIQSMLTRVIRENIELRVVLDPQLGNIKADPGQIEQVIMNLVINARDAMPDGGTLTIETSNVHLDESYISDHALDTPGDFIRISVTDSGVGMDLATRSRIFEPFFTTKEIGKGTGLGLSTVYGIVKQSGGDVIVYSEPGHGTTFKVYLPAVGDSVPKRRWAGEAEESYAGTETILLVEDEEIVRTFVSTILKANGYNVLEAPDGKKALEVSRGYADTIHMLLTDLIMPRMSGTELKNQLTKLRPGIKYLFMSGYTDDSISNQGVIISETAFIEKPFSPVALSQKVREVLE